jgi:hypothetical protein
MNKLIIFVLITVYAMVLRYLLDFLHICLLAMSFGLKKKRKYISDGRKNFKRLGPKKRSEVHSIDLASGTPSEPDDVGKVLDRLRGHSMGKGCNHLG